jgi:hypothetical protein
MGRIGNFLWVLNPFSKNGNLLDDMKFFHWAYNELKKDFPENYLRPPFPENHSLIIWGLLIMETTCFGFMKKIKIQIIGK